MRARITVRSALAGFLAAGVVGLASASGGCSLVVDTDIKAGLGQSCKTKDDCQGEGADCTDLICTTGCTTDSDCDTGTLCSPVGNRCLTPLKIGAIFIGNSGEGWTKTHGDGLAEVGAALKYPEVTITENVTPGPDTQKLVRDYIAAGNKVIVATSTSYNADIIPIAAEYADKDPELKFLVCEGSSVTGNLGSYYGRREQAWFLAGQVAAQKTATGRLGIVGSYVSPDTVRNTNAFLLGARSVPGKEQITVEVRWSGFWFDYNTREIFGDDDLDGTGLCTDAKKCFLEDYLTDKLIAGGADIVTHQSDVDRSIKFVELYNTSRKPDAAQVFSIANNNRYGCLTGGNEGAAPLASCLSAVYWNWTPLYTRLFGEMEHRLWVPSNIYENIIGDANESTVGLQQTTLGNAALDQFTLNGEIDTIVKEVKAGNPNGVFSRTQYATNDRPEGNVTGPLSDDQVQTMCWFAQGVVEQRDDACAQNPTTEDCKAGIVPAKVPRGDRSPWQAVEPYGETGAAAFDCTKHGGK